MFVRCLIFITIYGVVCVQLAHFSIGDWKDLSIAHVIIIIKSEVSTFPIVIIFFRGCVSEILLHHIPLLIAYTFREKREFVFIIIVLFMISANNRIRFVLKIVFACLYITPSHYHHCANLPEDIELIKCLSVLFCRVCEQDKVCSLSNLLYNTWGCLFSIYPFPCDDWANIYTWSYYHHQIGSMNYYPLFRVRS